MNLPKSVRVGYRDYPVVAVPKGDETEHVGKFTYASIRVHDCGIPAETADTLLHEVLHACWHQANMSGKESEEKVVTVMAHQLCQVIRDNPQVVKFLTEALK